MTKTYDYKKMIEIYVSIPQYDHVHEDFRNYREKLVAVLEGVFGVIPCDGIDNQKPKTFLDKFIRLIDNLLGTVPIQTNEITQILESKNEYGLMAAYPFSVLFQTTVKHIRRIERNGVGGSWLEGGPQATIFFIRSTNSSNAQIDKIDANISALQDLHESINEKRYQLLYDIFVFFHGNNDKVISSEDLLELGFDDSKEPKISDYYDYF